MGHTYWEIRAETHLTDRYASQARDIIRLDHALADRHLERIISPTIFSVPTNRRIFRGIVHLAHTRTWQRAMQTARERSRWLLTDGDIERFLGADLRRDDGDAGRRQGAARSLDPSGHRPLRQAKQMRRAEILKGAWYDQDMLVQVAEQHFALPIATPGLLQGLDDHQAVGRGRAKRKAQSAKRTTTMIRD